VVGRQVTPHRFNELAEPAAAWIEPMEDAANEPQSELLRQVLGRLGVAGGYDQEREYRPAVSPQHRTLCIPHGGSSPMSDDNLVAVGRQLVQMVFGSEIGHSNVPRGTVELPIAPSRSAGCKAFGRGIRMLRPLTPPGRRGISI
jgi:hypothetical protein